MCTSYLDLLHDTSELDAKLVVKSGFFDAARFKLCRLLSGILISNMNTQNDDNVVVNLFRLLISPLRKQSA